MEWNSAERIELISPPIATHLRVLAVFGLTRRTMPPSFVCSKLPSASKAMNRESGCGPVALAPLQTTFCQAVPLQRNTLPLKALQPLALGVGNGAPHTGEAAGQSCRSPLINTTLASDGSAAKAP